MLFVQFGVLQANCNTDGAKDVSAGVRLAEVTGATGCLRLRSQLGIVVRRDEDDGGGIPDGSESLAQLQPGHPCKLDIEHQAIKPRTLRVREESFGGEIRDRLEVRRPEQPAQRPAKALVVINNRNIDVLGAAHE